jgi:hypothetical protein
METLEIKKNCENCSKISVCKFVEKYKETVNSNLMYEMFAYPEHNNLMSIFKDNASYCIHYSQKIPDGVLNFKLHGTEIFGQAIRKYADKHFVEKVASISYGSKVEDIKIHYMKGNGYVQLDVDPIEIEKSFEVKYVNKK